MSRNCSRGSKGSLGQSSGDSLPLLMRQTKGSELVCIHNVYKETSVPEVITEKTP